MYNTQTSNRKDIAQLVNLMQVAADNEQPITLNMTLAVFNGIMEYRVQQALDAYKQQELERKDNGDLVTTKEAKAMFPNGLSDTTIWRWCKQGLLHKKNVGGKIFFSRSEIKKILEG